MGPVGVGNPHLPHTAQEEEILNPITPNALNIIHKFRKHDMLQPIVRNCLIKWGAANKVSIIESDDMA